jgi:hypothetical protein
VVVWGCRESLHHEAYATESSLLIGISQYDTQSCPGLNVEVDLLDLKDMVEAIVEEEVFCFVCRISRSSKDTRSESSTNR